MKQITHCYKCRMEKSNLKTAYCPPCQREYTRQRRQYSKKEYSYEFIETFRQRVIYNHYLIDLNDLNTIISIYCDIVTNINEYDNLPSGKQIMKMWNKILKYKPKVKEIKVKIKIKKDYSEKQKEWKMANKDRINQKRREYYLLNGK